MKLLDDFTRAYLECALWSTLDGQGEPLDGRYSIEDFSPEAIEKATDDCVRFQAENEEDLWLADYGHPEHSDYSMAGHDFWLTLNGHGAGFWDGDLPEKLGDRLTEASKTFKEVYIEEHHGKLFIY